MGFPGASAGKESSCNVGETHVQSPGWEDPLEKETATHSSILAWRIPWTVWSMGSQRVGHDLATKPPPPPYIQINTRNKETVKTTQTS